MRMVKAFEEKLDEQRLSSLVLFSLEKRRLRGDSTEVHNFLVKERRKGWAGTDLFSVLTSDRT